MARKQVNTAVNIGTDNRLAIDEIKDEWRMNIQETVAALVALWNNSTDDQKVNAIRRPVRETITA